MIFTKPQPPKPHQHEANICLCGCVLQDGQWVQPEKNIAAQMMLRRYRETRSDFERAQIASDNAKKRWARISPATRQAMMHAVWSRPRLALRKPRCPCGRFTVHEATKKKHYCTVDKPWFTPKDAPPNGH